MGIAMTIEDSWGGKYIIRYGLCHTLILCYIFTSFKCSHIDYLNIFSGDITTAAILHLSGSAPPKLQFTSTDFNSYNTVKTGTITGGDKCDGGRRMKVPTVLPGLGVSPNKEVLKHPLFVIE